MATFTKRKTKSGDVVHQVEVRLKGAAPQTKTFTHLTHARKWASKVETEIREGRYFPSAAIKKHTVGDAIVRYQAEVLPHKSASTQRDQAQQLGWWSKQIGNLPLFELSAAIVTKYKSQLAAEPIPSQSKKVGVAAPLRYRSNSTINSYLAVLSHVCTTAVKEWEWLERNPLENVRKQQLNNARTRFLSDAERERLLAECQKFPRLYIAVLLSLSTGARKNEIWQLKWHQVDLERKSIILYETKNKQIRPLPIIDKIVPMLRGFRAETHSLDHEYLFAGLKEGKSFDFSRQWEACLASAGIADFRYHDLRHTAASYLAMSGATLVEIADILGHKSQQMSKRYSHLTDSHKSKVVERMAAGKLNHI